MIVEKEMNCNNEKVVYETENFIVLVPDMPHIPKLDGGHLYIKAKELYFNSRTELSPKLAVEVMRVTMLLGEAMKLGLKNRGINIERINYQENGNWAYLQKGRKPFFHIHLYGRTIDSVTQVWGEALEFPDKDTGFYRGFEPFDDDDIEAIKEQISILEKSEKYDIKNWQLI